MTLLCACGRTFTPVLEPAIQIVCGPCWEFLGDDGLNERADDAPCWRRPALRESGSVHSDANRPVLPLVSVRMILTQPRPDAETDKGERDAC